MRDRYLYADGARRTGSLEEPVKWNGLEAELPEFDVTAGQATGTHDQRESRVALHKPDVGDAARRRLRGRRFRVTAQEKTGHGRRTDMARATAICKPFQLDPVALYRSGYQPISCGYQDAAVRIEGDVGYVHACLTDVR